MNPPNLNSLLASVAVGRPVRGEFTYLVPESLAARLSPGHRVVVPFGRGSALGFYLGPARGRHDGAALKPIHRLLDAEPALPPDLLALLRFAAEHYCYPLGETLRGALPPGLSGPSEEKRIPEDVERTARVLPGADPKALTRAPAQSAVLSYLLAVGGTADVDEVAHAIPGAREHLRKLEERGWVALDSRPVHRSVPEGLRQGRPLELTREQGAAVAALVEALGKGFQPFLLHGVTGSGKTEVYLRTTEAVAQRGQGALILVPEIALTPQLVGRFRSRFGQAVAVLHSGLKDRERLRDWQALRRGDVRIAVGVRSAIFAPVRNLALVVVDEEHDPSFKQDEKLRYQARDLAVVRAKQVGATVVLGSATPSLESLENVRRGRYRLLELKARVDDRPMPRIELVDLRAVRPRGPVQEPKEPPLLAPALIDALSDVLGRGQQAILFLNRRGHSTFLLCEVCGVSVRCRDCDVCLTHHLSIRQLLCHYCGAKSPVPDACLDCGGPLLKLGFGTEKVEAEVAERFPKARVARLDRDAASSAERLTELLASFARREVDVLVGTQMVAKGHDFPGVTLVCIVMADTALALPDFRAAERTFQLLTQVSGRAGRGADPGRVLIQTYNPDAEPVLRAQLHDFEGFSALELERRRALAYPPYTRMVAFRIEGPDAIATRAAATSLGERLSRRVEVSRSGVRLLGPAPAPIARIKGKTRWQLLLKGPTHAALRPLVAGVEALISALPSSVKVVIDVDPGAML